MPRALNLNLTLQDDLENENKGHFCVKRPKLDPGTRFGGNLDPSLNTSLNTALTSGSQCRK